MMMQENTLYIFLYSMHPFYFSPATQEDAGGRVLLEEGGGGQAEGEAGGSAATQGDVARGPTASGGGKRVSNSPVPMLYVSVYDTVLCFVLY